MKNNKTQRTPVLARQNISAGWVQLICCPFFIVPQATLNDFSKYSGNAKLFHSRHSRLRKQQCIVTWRHGEKESWTDTSPVISGLVGRKMDESILKSKEINLSPNLKTNCLVYNYNNSLHPYSALILLCDIGETVWFSILDRIGFLLWVLTQYHLLQRLKLKAEIWMQVGRDLAFWQFSFMLIVTNCPYLNPFRAKVYLFHMYVKQSNQILVGKGTNQLVLFFPQVLDFQSGIFLASQRML